MFNSSPLKTYLPQMELNHLPSMIFQGGSLLNFGAGAQLSNNKNAGCLGYIEDYTTQLCRDFINHEIKIPLNHTRIQWKVSGRAVLTVFRFFLKKDPRLIQMFLPILLIQILQILWIFSWFYWFASRKTPEAKRKNSFQLANFCWHPAEAGGRQIQQKKTKKHVARHHFTCSVNSLPIDKK